MKLVGVVSGHQKFKHPLPIIPAYAPGGGPYNMILRATTLPELVYEL